MANFNLELYRNMFCSLHCQTSGGILNAAKPIMVLAILETTSKGKSKNNRFLLGDLEQEYNCISESFQKTTPFQYPFYFLESEGFYHLSWKNGRIKTHTPSARMLRENIEYAYLDNALWDLLQEKETRDYLKETIINFYLK